MKSEIKHTKTLDELLFNVKTSKSFNDELFHKENRENLNSSMQHMMMTQPNIIIGKDGKVKWIDENGNPQNLKWTTNK